MLLTWIAEAVRAVGSRALNGIMKALPRHLSSCSISGSEKSQQPQWKGVAVWLGTMPPDSIVLMRRLLSCMPAVATRSSEVRDRGRGQERGAEALPTAGEHQSQCWPAQQPQVMCRTDQLRPSQSCPHWLHFLHPRALQGDVYPVAPDFKVLLVLLLLSACL